MVTICGKPAVLDTNARIASGWTRCLSGLICLVCVVATVIADKQPKKLPGIPMGHLGTLGFRHGNAVLGLAYSPDGKMLVSAGRTAHHGNLLQLWDVATGKLLRNLPCTADTKTRRTWAVAFSPDGKTIAFYTDAEIALWKLKSDHVTVITNTDPGGNRLMFYPDGKTLAYDGYWMGVCLYDLARRKEVRRFGKAGDTPLGFSGDGKRILTANDEMFKSVLVSTWKMSDGKEVSSHRLRSLGGASALSSDGAIVAVPTVEDSCGVQLYSTRTGKLLNRTGLYAGSGIAYLAFSPDGKRLVSAGKDTRLWFWSTQPWKSLGIPSSGAIRVRAVAFSPDSKTLATGGEDGNIRFWDTATGKPKVINLGHREQVTAVTFSPDGKVIATVGYDRTLRLWDRSSRKQIRGFHELGQHVYAVSFSPDGKLVAVGGAKPSDDERANKGWLALYEVATGKLIRKLDNKIARPFAIKFSSRGGKVCAVELWGHHYVWDVASGHSFLEDKKLKGSCPSLYRRAAVDLDRGIVAIGGAKGLLVQYLGSSGAKFVLTGGNDDGTSGLCLSPQADLIAWSQAGFLSVVEVASGQEISRIQGRGKKELAQFDSWFPWDFKAAVFSHDGRLIATGGPDAKVQVWDTVSGRELGSFVDRQRSSVDCLAFSPDSKLLVSGHRNGACAMWDLTKLNISACKAQDLTEAQIEKLWRALASKDAKVAHAAVLALASGGDKAAEFIGKHLKPVPYDVKRIERLVADLDHAKYKVREQATQDLKVFGADAESMLRAALANAEASLEVKQRCKLLLDKMKLTFKPKTPPDKQTIRAIAVLRRYGGTVARRILKEIANGRPSAWLTRYATVR